MKTLQHLSIAAAMIFSVSFWAGASAPEQGTGPCSEAVIAEHAATLASENCDAVSEIYITQARSAASCAVD